MSLTALVLAGSAFAAGVCVGVFLSEYDILTADHIRAGGTKVVEHIRLRARSGSTTSVN